MSVADKIIAVDAKIEVLEQQHNLSISEEKLVILHRITAKENQLTQLYKLIASAGKNCRLVHSIHRIYTNLVHNDTIIPIIS